METICSNCGSKNKSTNIKCENCGSFLNKVEESRDINLEYYTERQPENLTEEQKKANQKFLKVFLIIFLIMFMVPFIIIGVAFLSISSLSNKLENMSGVYYEVQGSLIGYSDVQSNGTYKGIYEYDVNGKKYTVITNYASNVDIFEDYVTVKYNPENPENAVVKMESSDLETFSKIGFSMFSIIPIVMVIIFVIFIIKVVVKMSRKGDIKS